MLTNEIHRAMARGYNRFQVCRITARGVRVMHKPGERFEDTINMTLTGLGEESVQPESAVSSPEPD